MVFTHFAWAIYSSKINILYRYCVTTEPMCRPPNEDSTRPILNECVPATVPSEMCEYRSDDPQGFAVGQFQEIGYQFIGVLTFAKSCHRLVPPDDRSQYLSGAFNGNTSVQNIAL